MIKINLIEEKKSSLAPQFAGIDLRDINWKLLIVALILLKVPDWFLVGFMESQVENIKAEGKQLKEKRTELNKYLNENKQLKTKLDLFERRVTDLRKREEEVDKLLKTKSNPVFLLESIARGIPKNVWLNQLTIEETKQITLNGVSLSLEAINSFVQEMNKTPFFQEGLRAENIGTAAPPGEKKPKGQEQFNITGTISTYYPWNI